VSQARPQPTLTSVHNDPALAQADHAFYGAVDQLLVTRGEQVVGQVPCERLHLPREERWPTHHIGGHVARTGDGSLHALVSGGAAALHWRSTDAGVTWQGRELCSRTNSAAGAFAVLDDGAFLLARGGGERAIEIARSTDCGATWEPLAEIAPAHFDAVHVDGNLLQLADGTVLLAVNCRLSPPAGEPLGAGHYPQYLFRSTDRGATWSGGGDPAFWRDVRQGREQIRDDHPQYTWPGEGGSFSGVYETGFLQARDGRVLGAFRLSGFPKPWHAGQIAQWGQPPPEPDGHGRLFRHVVLGESADGGRSWQNLRPIIDAAGQPLMAHGECNGELVQLSDESLVLIHQTRYADPYERSRGWFRGRSQLCARVSHDVGRTWRPERYRLLFGFGYPGSLALKDDTIVTVVGCCLGDNGDPRRAAVVRWRPLAP